MVTIKPQALEDFVQSIFAKVGCSDLESRRIAHSLVKTNLTGHDSHGVIRVPRYIAWLEEGTIVANQTVARVVDMPALAVIDGRFGFGQSVAPQAVAIGTGKCRAGGRAAIAFPNAGPIRRRGEVT